MNITYLIPLDTIGGGVEVAAKEVKKLTNDNFVFNVEYICKNKDELFNMFVLFRSIKEVCAIKPDILILSLWRSQFVGIFVKLFLPRTKLVFFVHSAEDAHILDYVLSRITLMLSKEVWGDSITSLNQRFKSSKKAKGGDVISFSPRVIERLNVKKVVPKFIFWGRLGKEKGLNRSLSIFSKLIKFYPHATFDIIGSDGGDLLSIKELCTELNINKSVTFHNEMQFEDIIKIANNAAFYLQTSLYEGAAMSVMESMKLGLVPVVTPVGEISRYCNNNNSVIVYSDSEVIRDLTMILESTDAYSSLSNAAANTFNSQESYVDSIVTSCEKLVKKWQ